jgi:ferredoxin
MSLVRLLPPRVRLSWLALSAELGNLRAALDAPRRGVARTGLAAAYAAAGPPPVAAPAADASRLDPLPAPPLSAAASPAASEPLATAQPSYRVHYRRRGVSLEVEHGQTLLGAALGAGLDLAHACQMGMCGTCKSRLLSGQVEMDQPNTLSDQERATGYCLPCVSHPRSEVELDA